LVALYVLTLYVKIYTFWRYTFRSFKFSRYTFSIYTFSRWIISLFQIFAKSLYSTLSGTEWRSQRDWLAQSVMSATDTLGQLGCMWLACRTPLSGQWTNIRTMKLKDTVIFTVAGSYCGAVWELPSEAVRPYSTVILTS
jgi:hypothetical protein